MLGEVTLGLDIISVQLPGISVDRHLQVSHMDWSQQGMRNALTASSLQAAHRSFTGISSMVRELGRSDQLILYVDLDANSRSNVCRGYCDACSGCRHGVFRDEMTGRVLGGLCRASCGNWLSRVLADVHHTNSRNVNGALFVILLRCHESAALVHEDDTSAKWSQACESEELYRARAKLTRCGHH